VFLGLVVEVGDSQVGAKGAECCGTTPGYRLLVRDANDEPFFALQQLGFDGRNQPCLAVLRRFERFAACVSFGSLLQGSKGVAPILGLGRSRYLLPVHLQLPFTPGRNVDFESIFPRMVKNCWTVAPLP